MIFCFNKETSLHTFKRVPFQSTPQQSRSWSLLLDQLGKLITYPSAPAFFTSHWRTFAYIELIITLALEVNTNLKTKWNYAFTQQIIFMVKKAWFGNFYLRVRCCLLTWEAWCQIGMKGRRVYFSNWLQNDNRLYVTELTSILGTDYTVKLALKSNDVSTVQRSFSSQKD